MNKNILIILYIVLLIVVIVSMDLLFFRHRFRERLVANIIVVVLFCGFYFLVLKRA